MIRLIWLKNLRNSYNSNKNLKRRNQIILPKNYLIVIIFPKRRIYSFVLFIPPEYFSFENLKLNAQKSNCPAKNCCFCDI